MPSVSASRAARADKTAKVTVAAAQKDFAGVMASCARRPVTVTQKGKPAAVLVSAQQWQALLAELEEVREDREWLDKIRNAKPVPYLGAKESLAFLRRIAN